MINTNRKDYQKDLEEVIYMFSDGASEEITHIETNDGENFYDEFTLDGNVYKFTNQAKISNDLELKRYEKRFSKLSLYKILSKKYGVDYEWGALTGIRPVKMAYSSKSFKKEFKDVFLVSDKKIELVEKIVNAQKDLYDYKGEYSSLFVGIPFCPSRCTYCSFTSRDINGFKDTGIYVDALVKEIQSSKELLKNPRSIYIGGGTPVCLSLNELESVLKAVKKVVPNSVEFTVEAGRPDAINKENLTLLKEYGVTRICVNPQTFKEQTLKIIGRNHSAKSVIEKYYLAKEFGFIVNADIIAGLPGESVEDFNENLKILMELSPENFTVHTLCLKRGSELIEKCSRLASFGISQMIDNSIEVADKNGYAPYYLYRQKYAVDNLENIGFSKPNCECVYNIDVMEETSDNVACGTNSVSKKVYIDQNRIERYGAPKDLKTYVSKIDKIITEKRQLFLNKA